MRAEIEGHAENRGVGDAAAADAIDRLEQPEAAVGGGDAARGGDTGRTGADNRHIDVGAVWARTERGAAATTAEAARNERRLSLDMVSKCFPASWQNARMRVVPQILWLTIRNSSASQPAPNEPICKFVNLATTRRARERTRA